jgi:hypothetical protein
MYLPETYFRRIPAALVVDTLPACRKYFSIRQQQQVGNQSPSMISAPSATAFRTA